MKIAKGKTTSNGIYIWECNNKILNHSNCPYCCGLEESKILDSFKYAKGQIYYGNLKAYLSIKGRDIYVQVKKLIQKNNKISVTDVMGIIDDLGFPRTRAKAFFEWLEETGLIPSGTYEKLKTNGFQPTKF